MNDLSNFDPEHPIHKLVNDIPAFIAHDITVGHVFDLMIGDADAYIQRLDLDWVCMVYRLHHHEVIDWCDLPHAELIDRDYKQQAVNFVIGATLSWCKKFCEVYTQTEDSETLSEKVGNCKVFYFDKYSLRRH